MAAANGEPVPSATAEDRSYERHATDSDPEANENTPLLPRSTDGPADQSQPHRERSAESLLRTLTGSKSARRRWPSILALGGLCLVVVLIIVFAFVAPTVVEQYAAQAVVFEPTNLSIAAFTASGVRARIQGDFFLDAKRVQRKPVRDLGIVGTWIAREVESTNSEVEVSLPEYGNVVLGVAHVPGIKVNVRNGQRTHVDLLSDLEPGNKEGIRRVAKDWIDGRLGQLRVVGAAQVSLKSGIFSFGSQTIRHEVLFENDKMPTLPAYDIKRLRVVDGEDRAGKIVQADVSLSVANDYALDFTVPSLGFDILVDNCLRDDPYIKVAEAITSESHVIPKQDVQLDVEGYMREPPEQLIQSCPHTKMSPLDILIGKYMQGESSTVYVRGSESSPKHTPDWVGELIAGITVPLTIPGREFGDLIKNFSLEDTHFGLPDPFADPKSPDSKPQISGNVRALVAIPEEIEIGVEAHRVRANADIFYKGSKLGKLDMHKWQKANSTRVGTEDGDGLLVSSRIENAPLNITNSTLFTDVVQDLLFGDESVMMQIKADVDVEIETVLGQFQIRRIPAEGEVPVKPLSSHLDGPSQLHPTISDLRILETSSSSLTVSASINFTNPTEYSADVPFIDIQFLKNSSLLGHATAKNLRIHPGRNENLLVQAIYSPATSASPGVDIPRLVGRDLLSQYLSGDNISIALRMHEGSLPALPALGRAMQKFEFEIPVPRLHSERPAPPDDGDGDGDGGGDEDDEQRFIRDATFHLFSSTAQFTLFSPLQTTTIVLERINATAYHPRPSTANDIGAAEETQDPDTDEPIATILYTHPIALRPGNGTQTPRLPVVWSLGSVGYETVREALGGELRVSAFAWVQVRLGRWREEVWFRGKGIGAKVRI